MSDDPTARVWLSGDQAMDRIQAFESRASCTTVISVSSRITNAPFLLGRGAVTTAAPPPMDAPTTDAAMPVDAVGAAAELAAPGGSPPSVAAAS